MEHPLIFLVSSILSLINMALLVYIIISFLISFNILNRHQGLVSTVYQALERLLEPMLRPIRKHLPDLNGIDISPIVLILILRFLEYAMHYYL
ncbi:MAG: YggT family protein [Rickettsiales bacterium]|nr:YggT family protein [Rickettsiales bacterium]